MPPLVLWVIRLLNLVFNFLNLFWFSKMLKGAIKVRAVLCVANCRLAGTPVCSCIPGAKECRLRASWPLAKGSGQTRFRMEIFMELRAD